MFIVGFTLAGILVRWGEKAPCTTTARAPSTPLVGADVRRYGEAAGDSPRCRRVESHVERHGRR
jgi:hypothetical protein